MNNYQIYDSILERTNGDIYVGVVGPVRTGKSTFITKFMEKLVLPNISDKNILERTKDELPQSGAGKTIMTMQPRFVPNESVEIDFGNNVGARIRLVDCVGYLIDGVQGDKEDGVSRLVKTPWAEEKITFEQASEIGTSKVIAEHSTIGVVVTTDGTITDIPRENYIEAEERVVNELKALGKPFVVILNSVTPESESSQRLKDAMIGVPVLALNVDQLDENSILNVFETVLYEFPIKKVNIQIPDWMQNLGEENEYVHQIVQGFAGVRFEKMKDYALATTLFVGDENIDVPMVKNVNLAKGEIDYQVSASKGLFYQTISEITQTPITGDFDLINYISQFAYIKNEYEKIELALKSVEETGYGIVAPRLEEMHLERPEVIKRGGSNGIKLKASAPSLHIMKVDVEAEVVPAVGGSEMLTSLVDAENGENVSNEEEIWNTNMFGKNLKEMAHDGIISKINGFPEEARVKLNKTVTKISNEGKGGIICVLL